jgi:dihydropteroate synthase
MKSLSDRYVPRAIELELAGTVLDLSGRVLVMGILNRTPDSFYDKGRYFELGDAIARAEQMIEEGADIIDVGGQKAGPGEPVSPAEEIDRVCPVIRHISQSGGAWVSVDTFVAEVAREAVAAGAHMINDISGLSDPDMGCVVAETGASIVVTHIKGKPRVPNPDPQYEDLLAEVENNLLDRARQLESLGVSRRRIILDAGLDLGKSTSQSLALLKHTGRLCSLGYPVMLSASNKRFIGDSLGVPVDDRLFASIAAAVYAVAAGARIVRVHNVAETVQAVRLVEQVLAAEP